MKEYKVLVYIALLSLLLLSSCQSVKMLSESKDTTVLVVPDSPMAVLRDSIRINDLVCESFSANFSATIESQSLNQSFSGQIRIIHDSILWVSIGKFGIEGMRLFITKDQAVLVNKIERTYSVLSFDEIVKILGVEVTLLQLQEFLLGNQISFSEDVSFVKDDQYWQLTSKFTFVPNYFVTLMANLETYQIEKMKFFSNDGKYIDLTYHYDNKLFKKGVYKSLEVSAFLEKEYNVVLNFNRVNYDQVGHLNLKIPSNYTRQQIF